MQSSLEPVTLKDSQYFTVIQDKQMKAQMPQDKLILNHPLYMLTHGEESKHTDLLVRDLV